MYTVESIAGRIMEIVQEVKELLGLTVDEAIAVLRFFKWNMDRLQNEWFEKEKNIRQIIGLEFDKNI